MSQAQTAAIISPATPQLGLIESLRSADAFRIRRPDYSGSPEELSPLLTAQNVEDSEDDGLEEFAQELRWCDSEGDEHGIYLTSAQIADAVRLPDGGWSFHGTDEPELCEPITERYEVYTYKLVSETF